jgi:hypothetical protein
MASAPKTPTHLWIVGGASALWNAFGAFDYVMTQTRNENYLAAFTDAQRDYFDSFPAWLDGAWALGVWGALIGSLLLLARSRYAVTAFGVSLFGLAATTVYQYLITSMPEDMMTAGMIIISIAIWTVAIGLFVYAMNMRKAGVLR